VLTDGTSLMRQGDARHHTGTQSRSNVYVACRTPCVSTVPPHIARLVQGKRDLPNDTVPIRKFDSHSREHARLENNN